MFYSLCARGTRRFIPMLLTVGAMLAAVPVFAGDVVLVEEEWELQVTTTDSNSTAPQIATAFSPTDNVDCMHAMFELNHQSVPDFGAGGLHLQLWRGEEVADTRKFPNPTVMSGGAETVTWTQRIKLDGTTLEFSIEDGTSNTWSAFGGQGYLKSTAQTSLANSNNYSPDISVKHSGVTFAGNRVAKLVLKRVRYVTRDGVETVDQTERVVHSN